MSGERRTNGQILVDLELRLHDVDCDWPNHHERGHGNKYRDLAVAALDVVNNGRPCISGHTDCTVDCGWCKGTGRMVRP
jgi:hypothetical protein